MPLTSLLTGTFYKYTSAGLGVMLAGAGIWVWILSGNLADEKEETKRLGEWQTEIVTTIKTVSDNEEVTPGTARDQIRAMGRSLADLTGAIDEQNEAIRELSEARDAALARRDAEASRRSDAIREARELEDKLKAAAEQPAPDSQEAIREMQDDAYEGGL